MIFGAWYLGEVAAEIFELTDQPVLGFVDPEPAEHLKTVDVFPEDASAFVAIGTNPIREYVCNRLLAHSRRLKSIFHPSAIVSASATLGENTFLAEYSVVRTAVTAGDGLSLQAGGVISHHCKVGNFVSIGPNAAIGSKARIGDRTLIGIGATIKPGIQIGPDCTIGAGAVVVRDIPAERTVVGNPARSIKSFDSGTRERQSNWKTNQVW